MSLRREDCFRSLPPIESLEQACPRQGLNPDSSPLIISTRSRETRTGTRRREKGETTGRLRESIMGISPFLPFSACTC